MYLKRLEVQGFKSFANKVEINFESGITGIVGPNGSGKSNIADSIRWVLGEQSAKTLRGSKMEDIIFSGTADRKPLGMAEVSITLDNSCKTLPIEYNEVTITRRVYRSGESEYYLNKSLCRLRDIRELLMDTGIGKDGYSIIGQGKIDEILSSRPEDRRQIFEEAAGIVKYRSRKDEAERKLSSTKENLLRVLDILYELKGQLVPLEKQSAKAKQFKILKEQLLKLEVNLFIREIDKLDNELKLIFQQINVIQKSIEEQEDEKKLYTDQIEELKKLINKNSMEASNKQDDYYKVQKYIEKIEGQINLEKERYNNFGLSMATIRREITKAASSQDNIKIKLEETLENLEDVCVEVGKVKAILRDKEIQYKKLFTLNSGTEKDINDCKSSIIDGLNEIANKKSESKSLKTLLDTMDRRMEEIQLEYGRYREEISQKEKYFNSLKNDLNKLENLNENTRSIIMDKTGKKEVLVNDYNELAKEIYTLQNIVRNKEARKNIVEGLEREREGFNWSVKNILNASSKDINLGEGVHGAVADLIKVPKGYETSIEIALGPALQYIVGENEEVGQKLIKYLKRHKLGRITVLPLTTIEPRYITNQELKIIHNFKDARLALDIIEFHEKFKNIFSNLLSRVLIVPDLNKGIQIAKLLKHRFKIVTIDGDLINIGGSLTGGSIPNKSTSILGRRRELDDLAKEIAKIEGQLKTKTSLHNGLGEEIKAVEKGIEKLNGRLQEGKVEGATLNSKIDQCSKEIEGLRNHHSHAENEMKQIKATRQETLVRYENLETEIKGLELEIAGKKDFIADKEEQLVASRQELDNISSMLTQHKVQLATIKEQKKTLLQNIDDLQETIKNNEKILKQKKIELDQNDKAGVTSREEVKRLEDERNILLSNLKTYEEDLQQHKNHSQLYENKQLEAEKLLKNAETILKELENSNYKLDIKRTKLEMQQQNFYTKLWEEYRLTYNEALQVKVETLNLANVNREVRLLKNKIKDLGSINLESINEYEKVKERYDFLREQEADLSQAKQSLIKIIKDMEETMENQFIEQFEIIRENFNDVFIKLFNGGKADLVLENKEDVLQSGIDIVAQPPGKKLQTISLLSGGEKALTAISLLFGILLAKPSPFCILDEIEAALDESNVYRYANFLEDLSKNTQFIVVTHRRGTMESANVLYGVTMQDEGISTLVSVKLTDKKEVSNIFDSA